jgi:predicted Zn-dependent protease
MYPRVIALLLAITLVSVQEEIEIGKQTDAQVRQKTPELRDGETTAYIRRLGQQLSRSAPGPKYPYKFSVADYREINAFALPGGPVWIHRGVLQSATNESQVAGVIAHEIAHVAQRHGTSQVTKAYGAQLGVGLLGQVLGGRDRRLGLGEQIVGSLGLNALFLKFGRNAENEADRVGAQMMARAGYDPMAMASFFDLLTAQQRRNPGAVEQFFSSHPSPRNRSANIRAQSAQLGRGRGAQVGGLQTVQARLDRMPSASRPQLALRGR